MHFYDFNIGDFAKKTQHLTNEEELAYRRALDLYYDTEQPLNIENIPNLSRRLRVNEKALENVINEFFPEGKNKHCDEKIAEYCKFIDKQKANGIKGGRPKANPNKPKPNPEEPKPKPTTTHKPLPNNQNDDDAQAEREGAIKSTLPAENSSPALTDIGKSKADPILTRALEISIMLRKGGASLTMTDPNVLRWAESGITDAQALTALETAQANRAAASSPQPINSGYLDSILRGGATPAEKKRNTGPPWWTSLELMDAKARELKIPTAKIGESMDTYKGRISAAITAAAQVET